MRPPDGYLLSPAPWRRRPRWRGTRTGVVLPQSPNIFWPHERSWCVATEVDLDSAVVVGTSELVRAGPAALGPRPGPWPRMLSQRAARRGRAAGEP